MVEAVKTLSLIDRILRHGSKNAEPIVPVQEVIEPIVPTIPPTPELPPVDPKQRYQQEWGAFMQGPDIVGIRQRINDLKRETGTLAVLPASLREQEDAAKLKKVELVAKTRGSVGSRRKLTRLTNEKQNLDSEIRGVSRRIEGLSKTLPATLARLDGERADCERELGQRIEEWALSGDEYRLLRFAVDNLIDNDAAREQLFKEYAEEHGANVVALRNKFKRRAGLPLAADDGAKVEGNTEIKRKNNGGQIAVADSPANRISERTYQKPTKFEIVLGVNQEPIAVTSVVELERQITKINKLGPLQAKDIWDRIERLANMDHDQIIRHERVSGGLFRGWYKYPIGGMWDVIFKIEGGILTFRVGHHDEVYGKGPKPKSSHR
ncbi:MAG: type II toxin-antitoxin system RelE/ParE family toxin [Candidatus Curtissbacteria bacterium]|nr:type II toxin-antitoxin system RelE/ParE family toxin [Candidatus Curtissbacteria bacterium]